MPPGQGQGTGYCTSAGFEPRGLGHPHLRHTLTDHCMLLAVPVEESD